MNLKIDGLLRNFIKPPQGSPGIGKAAKILGSNLYRNIQKKTSGDYAINPINTAYGTIESNASLQEDFARAQQERQAAIDRQARDAAMPSSVNSPMYGQELGVGFGEPASAVPNVKGISTQQSAPQTQTKPDESGKIPGSRMYTNSDEVWMWSPAEKAGNVPQKALDFYDAYNYSGNGKFKETLSPEYIQLVWNEIVQQTPQADANTRVALLETMLGMSHAESHGGYDAGGIKGRNTNVWNVGYNANPDSVLKYDPENPAEMADRAVTSMINDFNAIQNKGLSDQAIHNYHSGPKNAYNQAGVDMYKDYVSGWEGLYGPTYPWGN